MTNLTKEIIKDIKEAKQRGYNGYASVDSIIAAANAGCNLSFYPYKPYLMPIGILNYGHPIYGATPIDHKIAMKVSLVNQAKDKTFFEMSEDEAFCVASLQYGSFDFSKERYLKIAKRRLREYNKNSKYPYKTLSKFIYMNFVGYTKWCECVLFYLETNQVVSPDLL